jgi:putative transposase
VRASELKVSELTMKQKRHSVEEGIRILRQINAPGRRPPRSCRRHTSYGSRKKRYNGKELQDAKRYRELERENTELKKMVADHVRHIHVLKPPNSQTW